jgi:hypothetical protein
MANKTARKLDNGQKIFILQRLACYDSPQEVAQAFKEEYAFEISPQRIECYDPNKRGGKDLCKTWRELFESTRKAFLENVHNYVPEANKAVRIRMLANSAKTLKQRGNHIAYADMLERIAKELGNVHTNRRELTGADGKAVKVEDVTPLSDAQVDNKLIRLLQGMGIVMTEVVADEKPAETPTQH